VKRAKNSPIGQVECPVKSCVRICQVYKFRPRTEGRTSVFSGKFYAECPDHGRIGSDGNPATSKYIETNYQPAVAGPEKSAVPAPAPKPAARTSPAPSKPDRGPENPKPAARPWWQPIID
jgi:hypothetical protein